MYIQSTYVGRLRNFIYFIMISSDTLSLKTNIFLYIILYYIILYLSIRKRDNESAKLFLTPGICFAENVKLYLHAHQINFIITKHLDRHFLTIPTVASLSHQSKMFLHFQSLQNFTIVVISYGC